METINDKNYELWLVRYAEGDLTDTECQTVEQWLEGHPDAAEELALYQEAPRLQRDDSVHYAGAIQQRPQTLWSMGWRWVAAAAVLLLLFTPVALHLFRGTDQPVQVAQTTPPEATSTVADSILDVEATRPGSNNEAVAQVIKKALIKAATARPQASAPEPLVAIADEATESTEKPDDTEEVETMEVLQEEQPSSLIYVDNLIVYEDEPEPTTEYATINEVTYTNTENSINPIGHFISTFIKANR